MVVGINQAGIAKTGRSVQNSIRILRKLWTQGLNYAILTVQIRILKERIMIIAGDHCG
jgi:hypothetical protein